MDLNRAIIIGRMTADPETRALPSGQSVANFSVATNRVWTDKTGAKQEDTEFHNVVTFGRLADVASRYLTKGGLVMIEGRIQTRSWEDASGTRKYRTEIVAENLQLGPRSAGASAPNSGRAEKRDEKGSQKDAEEEIPVIDQDADISTDDIPF